ncbi:hypothetical protein J2Y74_005295 [Pseudomonas migulae]|nr:hypothetical protein [Pseudomonas migulae]
MALDNPNGTYEGGNPGDYTWAVLTITNANPYTSKLSGSYKWNNKTYVVEGEFFYSDLKTSDGPVTFHITATAKLPNNNLDQRLVMDFNSADRNYRLLQGTTKIVQGGEGAFSLSLGRCD